MKSRPTVKLLAPLDQRLNLYALAASAAGVSLLVASLPAEAKIVYTPAHKKLSINVPVPLDLNHDGITDFVLSFGALTHVFGMAVILQGNNQVAGYCPQPSGVACWASALPARVRIGPNQRLGPYSLMLFGVCNSGSCTSSGPWKNVQNRYLGLEFFIKGKVHYGWARLNCHPSATVLTGYAYETIPNKPIIAGRTIGTDIITVEPASLGHLAQGASAISTWRKARGN